MDNEISTSAEQALPGEERLVLPKKALRLLRETAEGSRWEILALGAIDPVKRWPGRRLTVRFGVEARVGDEPARQRALYGKLFGGRRGERSRAVLQALRELAADTVRIPEPLGYNAKRRFLLMEGLAGVPLGGVGESAARLETAMGALARFHSLPLSPLAALPAHDAKAEIGVLQTAVVRLGGAGADAALWRSHRDAAAAVAVALNGEAGSRPSLLHRDLHPSQILVGEAGVGLVDLDDAAIGEAELDLGNLLAHLQLAELQEHGGLGPGRDLAERCLAVYSVVRQPSPRRLGAYQAAALLRLASLERLGEPGRSVLPWPQLAENLVLLAFDALAR